MTDERMRETMESRVEGWLARTLERVTEAANRAPEWATSRRPGESACSASPFASVPAGPFLGQTRLVEARREFNYTNCVRNAVRLTISEAQSPPTRRTSAAEAEVERLRGLLKEAERQCVWSTDDSGPWDTECGHMFECIDGGPDDNGFKFCCYCGGELVAVAFDEEACGE